MTMKYASIPVEVLSDKVKLAGLREWFGEDGPFHEIAAIIEHINRGGWLNPLWLSDLLTHYRKQDVSENVDEYEMWLMRNPQYLAAYELYTSEEWLLDNEYTEVAPYGYSEDFDYSPRHSSGIKGVSQRRKDGKWTAQWRTEVRTWNVGVFDTKEEAAEELLEAQRVGMPTYRLQHPRYSRRTKRESTSPATSGRAGTGLSSTSGITWDSTKQLWQIRLRVDGTRRSFGYRKNLDEAEAALRAIKASYGIVE